MKLAEALKKRKALRAAIPQLASKIQAEAFTPEANPQKTIKQLTSVSEALASLSSVIAAANAATFIETKFGNLSLLQAKAVRDELIVANKAFLTTASVARQNVIRGGTQYDEASGRNVKVPDTVLPCCYDLEEAFQKANQAARDARDLDSLLQAANWATEVPGGIDE